MQRVCGTDGAIRSHQAGLEGLFLVLPTGGIRRQDPYPGSPRNGSLPPRLALWENDFLPQQQQQRKTSMQLTLTSTAQLCLWLRRWTHSAAIRRRERTELPEREPEMRGRSDSRGHGNLRHLTHPMSIFPIKAHFVPQ